MTKAGNVSMVGSGITDNYAFNFTILPGPISAMYSQVTTDQLRVVAGNNMTILINITDQFGNNYNMTNSSSDIQSFTSVS